MAIAAFVAVATGLVLVLGIGIVKAMHGLRVSREEEIDGLDLHEHGVSGYPDLVFGTGETGPTWSTSSRIAPDARPATE